MKRIVEGLQRIMARLRSKPGWPPCPHCEHPQEPDAACEACARRVVTTMLRRAKRKGLLGFDHPRNRTPGGRV